MASINSPVCRSRKSTFDYKEQKRKEDAAVEIIRELNSLMAKASNCAHLKKAAQILYTAREELAHWATAELL
jgi:hypothetical protein